jgi:hypothetical protein
MGNGFEQSTGPASIGRVDASNPSAPLTNGHHTPASAPTSAPASAPLLSTEAAAAPSKVLPEVPLQKTVAPIVAPVTQAVQDVASAAAKVVEPVKVAVAQGAGKASEALRQVQNQVQAQAPGSGSRPPVSGPEEAAKAKKRADVLERTVWTFIMIGGFIGRFHSCDVLQAASDEGAIHRTTSHGPLVHDLPGVVLSDTCVPGGHCAVLPQER